MKNLKTLKKIGLINLMLLIIILCSVWHISYICANETSEKRIGIYSWNIDDIDIEKIEKVSEDLDINSFYQYISTSQINESQDFKKLVNDLKAIKVNTYLLCGSCEFAYDTNIIEIKKIIDEIEKYNLNNEIKVEGIVLDAEFYLDEKYSNETKVECFNIYYQNMKKAYEYASEKEITFVLVIPYWLDTTFGTENLDLLIKNACDSVEVMNYHKAGSKEHIKNEILCAKKYNKSIVTISELQKENQENDVTSEITFYKDGLKACQKDMMLILKKYKYNKLGYAYHTYNYLIELYDELN